MLPIPIVRPAQFRRRSVYRVKHCGLCNAPMSVSTRGRPRKTCSAKCRQQYHRRELRHQRDYVPNLRNRAAERLLARAERYHGRVDETPLRPRSSISRRDYVLVDLSSGFPLDFCQWCGTPMTRRNFLGTALRCCSETCILKWHHYRRRLHDALERVGRQLDPIVKMRLEQFSLYRRVPQVVLRHEVRVCDHCDTPYPVYGQTSRFCSKRCRQAAWRRATRLCRFCKKRFHIDYRHAATHQYCSNTCRNRGLWRSSRPRLAERACVECGALYAPSYRMHAFQKYCSSKCSNRVRARNYAARKRAEARGLTLPILLPAGLIPSPIDAVPL